MEQLERQEPHCFKVEEEASLILDSKIRAEVVCDS